ncbi:MAG: vWA domain-containing protein [Gammaproteobacteria bacterium]
MMKTKIVALALFLCTAAVVALFPATRNVGAVAPLTVPPVDPPANAPARVEVPRIEVPKIEVVFVLDTTGSMGGLIQAAKEKIWSIATTMAQAEPAPEIKMGLVAYRDRGDAYVTRVVDLSADLDSMYATLMDFEASGGGDGAESVNQALYEAVHKVSWSQDPKAYKVVFLVGDAPPHMDYADDVEYPETAVAAKEKGIVINTVQCGQNSATTGQWQRIAALGDGRYLQVEQAGSAVAIATPFDEELARLSAKLDDTRLYYGSQEERAKKQAKIEATDKLLANSSVSSRARRAAFNVSKSGEPNLLGESELVDDVASGRVDLSGIDRDELPEPMQAMAPKEQEAMITEMADRRNEVQGQIKELAEKRSSYLKREIEAQGGAKDSLDQKLYDAVREQAGKAGLEYKAAAPAY